MRKTIVFLLALALVLTSSGVAVSAAQPYRTYTYDEDSTPVPSTNAYQVMTVIDAAAMGLDTPLKDARDIFVDNSDRVFIMDSGNSRILVLDQNYKCIIELDKFKLNEELAAKYGKEEITLKKGAAGLFFRESNKLLYIADTENDRIIVSDLEGNVSKIYEKPVDELLDPTQQFKPKKVIVDNMGIMYVTSGNINTGALLIDSAGSFLGFYGTNKLKETSEMKAERFWRSLMKQAASYETFQPVEFNNIFWSEDRFVYTVSPLTDSVESSVSKLNALGNNVFPQAIDLMTLQTDRKLNRIVLQDITVDNEGAVTVVDSNNCRLYQYDEGCNLLAVFGGRGYQQGLFLQPVSIDSDSQNRILILDADKNKNTITVMEQTFYGQMIREANRLYNLGLYQESIEPWNEVLRMNANYTQAYVGLGKAYMSLGEYKQAMEYFELGKDAVDYGEAKALLRDEIIRRNFALVAAVVVIGMFMILGWDAIVKVWDKLYWRFKK